MRQRFFIKAWFLIAYMLEFIRLSARNAVDQQAPIDAALAQQLMDVLTMAAQNCAHAGLTNSAKMVDDFRLFVEHAPITIEGLSRAGVAQRCGQLRDCLFYDLKALTVYQETA